MQEVSASPTAVFDGSSSALIAVLYCHEVIDEILNCDEPTTTLTDVEAQTGAIPMGMEDLAASYLDSLETLNYVLVRRQSGYL